MYTRKKILLIAMIMLPFYLYSQPDTETVKLKLDFPLFDLPYQMDAKSAVGRGFFGSYANPSMSQSLAVSTNVYSAFHFGMKHFYDNSNLREPLKRFIYFYGSALGNVLFFWMPGGEGWLHEEYHRAVMSRFGANSFNEMNLFPIGAEVIAVSRVKDEDLVRIKEKSPADMVRLHASGIEGQYLLINNLQRNNFFYVCLAQYKYDKNLLNLTMYWMSIINSHAYIILSASPNFADKTIASMNEKETTIASRDFTGMDFTAWAYDLFRPDEPYQARGVHPSGTGINRYRSTTDLTPDELKYLKRQGWWHVVNYMSPMLFGIDHIALGNSGLTGNFAMRHLLTSFGTAVSAHVFLKNEHYKMAFAYHNNLNYRHYFPAIEAELVDYPFQLGKLGMSISPRTLIGLQPKGQQFMTRKAEFLGLLGLRVDFAASQRFFPYIDLTAKTNGWVAGNEYLNSNASVRMGISARF